MKITYFLAVFPHEIKKELGVFFRENCKGSQADSCVATALIFDQNTRLDAKQPSCLYKKDCALLTQTEKLFFSIFLLYRKRYEVKNSRLSIFLRYS